MSEKDPTAPGRAPTEPCRSCGEPSIERVGSPGIELLPRCARCLDELNVADNAVTAAGVSLARVVVLPRFHYRDVLAERDAAIARAKTAERETRAAVWLLAMAERLGIADGAPVIRDALAAHGEMSPGPDHIDGATQAVARLLEEVSRGGE